jgi:hypothetical protein
MWPSRTLLPGFQTAFGNEEIRIPAKQDCIGAITGVGTVGDHLSVKGQAVPEAGYRVYKLPGLNRERDSMVTFVKFQKPYREGKLRERDRERFCNKCIQDTGSPGLSADHQAFGESEFNKGMQSNDMIDMKMTDKQVGRFFLGDVLVSFCKTISGVKDNVEFFCLDQDRACITGEGIIPAVGSQEGNLHGYRIEVEGQKRIQVYGFDGLSSRGQ